MMELFLKTIYETLLEVLSCMNPVLLMMFGIIISYRISSFIISSIFRSPFIDLNSVKFEKVVDDSKSEVEKVDFVESDSIIKYY